MSLRIIDLFEIIGIDHEQGAEISRIIPQVISDLPFAFLAVKKTGQGIPFRPRTKIVYHLLIVIDIRDHPYGFDWFPGTVILVGIADSAPDIDSIRILNADLGIGNRHTGFCIGHKPLQNGDIVRMHMPGERQIPVCYMAIRIITKFFLPVCGIEDRILLYIPFKNNIGGLIQDNPMPLQRQTQFFPILPGFCDIQ